MRARPIGGTVTWVTNLSLSDSRDYCTLSAALVSKGLLGVRDHTKVATPSLSFCAFIRLSKVSYRTVPGRRVSSGSGFYKEKWAFSNRQFPRYLHETFQILP